MLFDVQDNIQVTSRAAELANFSRACEANASAVFYARRNLRIDRALPQNSAFTFALQAGIGDHATGSLARGTRARDAKESLLIANLTTPVAGAAGGRSFARGGTRSVALFTGLVPPHGHARLGAEKGLFEKVKDYFM